LLLILLLQLVLWLEVVLLLLLQLVLWLEVVVFRAVARAEDESSLLVVPLIEVQITGPVIHSHARACNRKSIKANKVELV
jgi:hypothetical protein